MAKRPYLLERLEERCAPATFGIPWADPARLALSFAPDGTEIAGRSSALFEGLNQDRSPNEWQFDILRAFHAWASETNLDIAVVPDDGLAFGTPGRLQGDPRFGDIRIGGNRLSPDVLAFTSPPDPALSGTLAGDVFVNIDYRFKDTPYDLYSVMLHEAGHALGLDHSDDPESPLFPRFNNIKTTLTAGDIQAIQGLYGVRGPDRFEGSLGNHTLGTAAAIPTPTAYGGSTPLVAFAHLGTENDADVFWFDTVPGRDENQNITIQLRTAGLSLMGPRVTVYTLDEDGNPQEVANVKVGSDDFQGVALAVTFDGNDLDDDDFQPRRYFVRIEAAEDSPFRIGRYALAVTFDGVSTVPAENLDRVIAGRYDALDADTLAALLRDPSGTLIQPDGVTNETIASATVLDSTTFSSGIRRFEYLASLESAHDVDVYRVDAPSNGTSHVLTAHVFALPGQNVIPKVEILDAAGIAVPAEILVHDNGTHTVQATGLSPGANYFLKVTRGSTTTLVGNYMLTADFGAVATEIRDFASGQIKPRSVRTDALYIGQAQLFHLVLSVEAPRVSSSAAVRVTITDSNGNIVLSLRALAGQSASGPAVLLRPGAYQVRYEVEAPNGSNTPVTFRLRGNRMSDPIGPVLDDPTLEPEYGAPNDPDLFLYPGAFLTEDPFFWLEFLI